MNTAREIRNIWDEIGRMKGRTAGSSSGAVKTFLGLNDTPAAYAGEALQHVRVNAGANALEFAAGGGGGYTPPWQPDTFDGSEDSDRSDHFDDDAFDAAKWTKFQDANLTWTEEKARLELKNTGDALVAQRGFFHTVDSGSFTVTAKIGVGSIGPITAGDFIRAGIAIFEDATNNPNTCDLVVSQLYAMPSGTVWLLHTLLYTDYDTQSTIIESANKYYLINVMYLRCTWDETDLKFFVSTDGITWLQLCKYTPAFTPAEFGIAVGTRDSLFIGVSNIYWITYHDSDLGIAPCGSP